MTAPSQESSESASPARPQGQVSWLLGVIWLLFLGFPVAALLLADLSTAWTSVGMLLLVVFGLIYAVALYRLDHLPSRASVVRVGTTHLAAMLVVTAGLIPLLGADVIGLLPYVAT